jgi:hypothetical protein
MRHATGKHGNNIARLRRLHVFTELAGLQFPFAEEALADITSLAVVAAPERATLATMDCVYILENLLFRAASNQPALVVCGTDAADTGAGIASADLLKQVAQLGAAACTDASRAECALRRRALACCALAVPLCSREALDALCPPGRHCSVPGLEELLRFEMSNLRCPEADAAFARVLSGSATAPHSSSVTPDAEPPFGLPQAV